MSPRSKSEKILGTIEGCQKLLARHGTDREAFVLAWVVGVFLESMKGIHEQRPIYKEYGFAISFPMIFYALRVYGGNQVKVARVLGISRNTLRARLVDASRYERLRKLAREMDCWKFLPKERGEYAQLA